MAIEIGVSTESLRRVTRYLASAESRILASERRGVWNAAVIVRRRVLERVNRMRTGAKGFKSERARQNYAARVARGFTSSDFLFVRTGALRASVQATAPEHDFKTGGWLSRVGFRKGKVDKYAPVHEFGTNRAGRNRNVTIPARAPLRKALAERRREVRKAIANEVNKATRMQRVR